MEHGRTDPEARLGSVVAEKYQLVRVLGTGGMGAVYEAVHQFTARHVALKLMHARFAASAEAAARFLREAQAPSSIGHPAMVDVLDGGHEDDGSLYMTLELLQGEDLAAAMRDGRVGPAAAVEIALQLLDALDAAHARGFVHRDIKPANVFLTHDARGTLRVRLLDFGIARKASRSITEGLTAHGAILGTPDYMSPEQAKGDVVDGRADLWSLGAMLFHVLAGRPPFEATNVNVLLANLCNTHAPSLARFRADLPVELVAAIDGALRADPADRWPNAREMARAIASAAVEGGVAPAVASQHVSAPTMNAADVEDGSPLPGLTALGIVPRRSGRVGWAAAFGVVLAASAAVFGASRHFRAPPPRAAVAAPAPPTPPAVAAPAAPAPLEPSPAVAAADPPAVPEPVAEPAPDMVFVPLDPPPSDRAAPRTHSEPSRRLASPRTHTTVGRRHALRPVQGYD